MPGYKFNAQRTISSFLDQMIAARGENLNKTERLALRQKLSLELDQKIDQAIVAALPEDKLLELNRRMDAGMSDDDVEKFFDETGIDFGKVALEAATQFRRDYLGEGKAAETSSTTQAANAASATPAPEASAAPAAGAPTATPAAVASPTPASTPETATPSHDMTQNTTNNTAATSAPAGQPLQGTNSATPGAANVEGVAHPASTASAATATIPASANISGAATPGSPAAPKPAGEPLQGTSSAVPGASNVEGIARMIADMAEGGTNAE